MRRGKPTRLGTILLVIISAAFLISGLLWVAQTIFGGGSSNKTETVSAGQKLLDNPTETMSVRMSARGPIVAKEDHYSIVITISQTERQIVTYRGYDGEVIETKTIGNTSAAFKDFIAALRRASYMKENTGADKENQGICADGQLIQFEIIDNGKTAQKLWTTSCSKVTGSFGGLVVNVEDLFLNQISDSRQIIQNAKDAVE